MAAVNTAEKHDRRLDAEQAVIGSMLLDEQIVRDVLSRVESRDFLNSTNRLIFQTARELFRAGLPVDAVTIRDRIGSNYTDYLVQLMDVTPTSANWEVYAELMHEQAALQRIRDLALSLSEAVTLEDCRPLCADLTQLLSAGRKVDAWNMSELLSDFYRRQDPEQPGADYITYGIPQLDSGTYTELGDVVMIGGAPSSGKTALALMMAYHMAASRKVGFFSLETDKKKVGDRMVAHSAQIDFNAIKRRELREADWISLAETSKVFVKRDLTVIRGAGMTVMDIQAATQAYGFEVIFIDYIQLVVPEIDARAPRSEQMAAVSRALHVFAQMSGVAVVELAQLVRQERSGPWREPDMHDLKESGQFEQDADIIFLLFQPGPKSELDPDKHRILKIAKQKEGRRGKWPLAFDGAKQTFSVVTGDGSSVLRSLVEQGRAVKRANRRGPIVSANQIGFAEIEDAGDDPWKEGNHGQSG